MTRVYPISKSNYHFDNEEDEDEYEKFNNQIEGKTNIKLILTKRLKDKLDFLSYYTNTEVGGFLTFSEIKESEDEEITIVLNDILIPPQTASISEVDISDIGQVALRKEYGDKCLNIIGHYHSHNTMGCFFSGTDEEMMEKYSENKPFRIFIVGSEGKHLIRLVLRNNFNDKNLTFKIENIKYEVEIDDTVKIEMENEIKAKVKKIEYKDTYVTPIISTNKEALKKIKTEINARIKYLQHQNHKVKINCMYKYYAKLISEEFKNLNPIIEKSEELNHYDVIVELGDKNKAKEFMVDIKDFLLKTLLEEKTKLENAKPSMVCNETAGLEDYLNELDEEDIEDNEGCGDKKDWKDERGYAISYNELC